MFPLFTDDFTQMLRITSLAHVLKIVVYSLLNLPVECVVKKKNDNSLSLTLIYGKKELAQPSCNHMREMLLAILKKTWNNWSNWGSCGRCVRFSSLCVHVIQNHVVFCPSGRAPSE